MTLDRRAFLSIFSRGATVSLLPGFAHRAWDELKPLPTPEPAPGIADDPLRPQYHLLPPHNWMNDPNGPIWWKGKYHLFYQLNPHAAVWGDMHWGHAISPDMVHWHHEPIALAPTPGGPDSEGCFSGSAVVFNGVPTLIYTGVQNAPPQLVTIHDGSDKLRETQLLATAEDDSMLHWKKLAQPVIASPPAGITVTGFRDPCPWREPDGWYLGVGSGVRGEGGCVLLYKSEDFRHWQYLHPLATGKPNGLKATNPCDSGEMWECPDFFSLDGSIAFFIQLKAKLSGQPANMIPTSIATPRNARVCWIMARTMRPKAFSRPAAGAFCGDGFRKGGPKPSLPPQDGPAPCPCPAY